MAAQDVPVTVNVSHLRASVTAALGGRGIPFEVLVEEPEPLGTGGTLRALREQVNDRVIVWNSDIVADLDLDALLHHHVRSGQAATLAVAPVDESADFTLRDGRLERLVDRRREDAAGARFVGVAVYEREALDLLDEERVPLGATEGLLAPLLERGQLGALEHRGYARDVGTLERYLRVSLDLLEGSAPPPPGGVPGEIVDVEGGRAYVGPGAEVGRGRLGPGAILLAGSSIADGARAVDSIVWPGEHVPRGRSLDNRVWFRREALRLGDLLL